MQHLHYADWTASGRLYGPIEKQISEIIGQFVANTHTETNLTGCAMTLAYKKQETSSKNTSTPVKKIY
jgi:hypothetical protein